jgi:hypothetical protein
VTPRETAHDLEAKETIERERAHPARASAPARPPRPAATPTGAAAIIVFTLVSLAILVWVYWAAFAR